MEHQFKWHSSTLNYRVFGHGKRVIIAFHGFDQNSNVFEFMQADFGSDFRIISIDLPHQGNTIWLEDELNQTQLVALVTAFKKELEFDQCVVLGFSLGGNYAMGLTCADPKTVEELWLVASDGLKPRPLFIFLTSTTIGRWLFKLFIAFPLPIQITIRLASLFSIIPKRTGEFFLKSIASREQRTQLMNRWSSAARILPRPGPVITAMNRGKINCKMLFGLHDSVIPVKNARTFARKLALVEYHEVDDGHMLLRRVHFKRFLA